MPIFDFNQEKKDAVQVDKTYELIYSNERVSDAQHPIMILDHHKIKSPDIPSHCLHPSADMQALSWTDSAFHPP